MVFFSDLTSHVVSIVKFDVSDDTVIHQTNRKLCVAILVGLSILVSFRQYGGDPIACFCPAEFEKFHVAYTNSYCWIRNTYGVSFDEILPVDDVDREDNEILYYQWVPLILLLQAFMFYIPRIFWKGLNGHSGINIKKVLLQSNESTYLSPEKRDDYIWHVAYYIDKWISIRDGKRPRYRRFQNVQQRLQQIGIHSGNFLSFLHVFTCAFYALNTFGQIFLVDALLGNDFLNLGPDFIHGIANNRKWEDLRRFPRVTFCDMDIRQLQNVQRWTIQCSLPINLFNEKVFILLWFLLIFMTFVNCIYLMYNTFMLIFPQRKLDSIRKYMDSQSFSHQNDSNTKLMNVDKKFVNEYLRQDGVFLIWLISQTSSQVVACDLVDKLWKNFCKKPEVHNYLFVPEIRAI